MIREHVYTIQEAAAILTVNRDTVRRWMQDGKLAGESIGAVVLLPRWTVDMLKQEHDAKKAKVRRKRTGHD